MPFSFTHSFVRLFTLSIILSSSFIFSTNKLVPSSSSSSSSSTIFVSGGSSATTVTELDGIRFRNALQAQTGDNPNDLLVLFYDSSIVIDDASTTPSSSSSSTTKAAGATCHKNTLPYIHRTMDQVAQRLQSKDAVQLATYDIHTHGIPAGLHLHNHNNDGIWLLLFPTPEANPRDEVIVYNYKDDIQNSYDRDIDGTLPCPVATFHHTDKNTHNHSSPSPSSTKESVHVHTNGETCKHDHSSSDNEDHHHHEEHEHAHVYPRLTIRGILRWLKKYTTFPAEIPYINEVSIADKYKDRSEDLWTAVVRGLEALQQQMKELQQENIELREQLLQCQSK